MLTKHSPSFLLRIATLVILLTLTACNNETSEQTIADINTITVGNFRLTGSAESGQYAPHLFKINRLIRDQIGQTSGWKVIETDRLDELISTLPDSKIPKNIDIDNVRYIVLGEMDGFDLTIADHDASSAGSDGPTLAARKRIAHSRLTVRVVDCISKQWLATQIIDFSEPVPDEASAETQINSVLSVMASKIVNKTLLAISGSPTVAGVNPDGTVVLNRGSMHGMSESTKWSLSRNGEPITNPENGKVLTTSSSIVGQLTVVRVDDNFSIANFEGQSVPKTGDTAIPLVPTSKNVIGKQQTHTKIRVALGGIFYSPEAQQRIANTNFDNELQAALLHRLQKDTGLSVIEQKSDNIKKLLAQQMLTDLNKGREPGLPLGTLKGVDYLLFGKLDDIDVTAAQDVKLRATNQIIKNGIPANAYARAHLYLLDVNSGKYTLSQEIESNYSLPDSNTPPLAGLITQFGDEVQQRFLLGLRPLRIQYVNQKTVTLNHGKSAGLFEGMNLEVFTKGESQFDPKTGQLMHGIGSHNAALVEITGFTPQGWALAKVLQGEPVKGMPVKVVSSVSSTKKSTEDTGPKLNW